MQHLHKLFWDERIHRETALRYRGEEQGSESDTERLGPTDKRDRYAKETRATGEALLLVVLVAEYEIDSTQTG